MTGCSFSDDLEAQENFATNRSGNRSFAEIVARRLSRRTLLSGAAAAGALALAGTARAQMAAGKPPTSFTFEDALHKITETHQLAKGYKADIVLRWGDPVVAGAPAFDPLNQTGAAQARQFGYNNDYVAYLPLPAGSNNSEHGLLAINHEYVNPELMRAGIKTRSESAAKATKEWVDVEIAAHGMSVVEVRKEGGVWRTVDGSRFARRITMTTEMIVSGPAAGHARLKTADDPAGTRVLGTLNNCAGGKTPWGTVLTGEENFNFYFAGDPAKAGREAENHRRMGIAPAGGGRYAWSRFYDRFDTDKTPHEPNRFGWLVEVDPHDPAARPIKRTALGRCKHEGASIVANPDGRIVVYSGDDQAGEYIYKFVSAGRFDAANRAGAGRLLDDGTLHAGRFDDDGTVEWLPLVHGQGPLTAANGFADQGDVLIEARRAADLMGATRMDRPEDIEISPATGKTYVALTNNGQRGVDAKMPVNKANPRRQNAHGHVLEIIPPGTDAARDHAAATARWDIIVMGGHSAVVAQGARYHKDQPKLGPWLSSPDNIAIDARGRLFLSTDQGAAQLRNNIPDGIYTCDAEGPGRAYIKFLFGCPAGAEMCGPELTPDGRTLFLAVQHPAEEAGSHYDAPLTRWPDFKPGIPPRPSLLALTRQDGGEIGT